MRTPKSWLSAISGTRTTKSALLGLAALGLAALGIGGAIAMTPTAAHASEGGAPAALKIADYNGALQPNGYYCAPAAARIALSAHGHTPSYDDLATDLGTTTNGTNSINDVTRVLNKNYGEARYTSVEISARKPSQEQVDRLKTDVVTAINQGDPVVANIAGTTSDTIGELHSYAGGHYLTITGYTEGGNLITVTDPADRVGSNEYQVPVDRMANWIGTRGYTA